MFDQFKHIIEQHVSLTTDEWQTIQSKLVLKRLPKHATWMRVGDVCSTVAFINAGAMHCFHRKGDKEITSHLLFEQMFCADFQSLMFQQPAVHTIETLEACEMILLRYDALLELRRTIPAVERFTSAVVQQFLLSEMKRTASFLLKSPDERYLELMRDLPQALQRVPQYILASYLNMTPETFSRVRNRIRHIDAPTRRANVS
jgi:CRP/FNR family transcriptional regulator, anaerobic regulatory protein